METVEKFLIAVFVLMIPVFISVLVIGHWQSLAREKFLEDHGCQLLTTMDSGKLEYCGKACWRHKMIYAYECRDGTRMELH